ncbi:hypothetical protein BH23PLA1_BH23PLA1_35080 [soil metagenome]
MSREPESRVIPRYQSDLEEVCRLVAAGEKVTDPDLLERIRARSEAAQRQMLERHGVGEWAVDLVREAREVG